MYRVYFFIITVIGINLLRIDSFGQATNLRLQTLTGHAALVRHIAFSRDGKTLASASFDKTVKLWDVATGTLKRALTGHADSVFWVAFSPNGNTIATGSGDRTVKLWDAQSGKLQGTLTGHSGAAWSGAFAPDGKTLATASEDTTVRIWDARSGKTIRTLTGEKAMDCVAFSPDGKQIASGSDDNQVRIWDAQSGELKRTLEHKGHVYSVAFSPDGKTLASGSADKSIKLWDAQTGELKRTIQERFGRIYAVAFSPDGKLLASAESNFMVKVWNVETGAMRQMLTGHHDAVWSVAFSPDGRALASAGEDNLVKFWDWERPDPVMSNLPKSVDLRPKFAEWGLPVTGQHGRGTCSVHTFTGAMEFVLSRKLNKGAPLSDEFLNWACNQIIGNVGPNAVDRGQFFEHLWMGYAKYGICLWDFMPFSVKFDPNLAPSADALRNAKENQAHNFAWRYITKPGASDEQIIAQVKTILANGLPVLAGSSHSVLIVGYNDDDKWSGGGYFIIADSGWNGGRGGFVARDTGNRLHTAIAYARVRDYGFSWVEAPLSQEEVK